MRFSCAVNNSICPQDKLVTFIKLYVHPLKILAVKTYLLSHELNIALNLLSLHIKMCRKTTCILMC